MGDARKSGVGADFELVYIGICARFLEANNLNRIGKCCGYFIAYNLGACQWCARGVTMLDLAHGLLAEETSHVSFRSPNSWRSGP